MGNETTIARGFRRLIGAHAGAEQGPVVLAICGIHGNEPAGVRAAQSVLEKLSADGRPFRGEFVAVCGNLAALAVNRRYVEQDLNRLWSADRIAELKNGQPADEATGIEEREQREIWSTLQPVLGRARHGVVLLDLHTSSADGPPFATMGDTLRNRRFVTRLPVPVILGLEEQIDGSLLEGMNNLGFITAGLEAGRHDLASSVDHHEALIWLSLIAAGCLDERDVPDAAAHRGRLGAATEGIPRIVEMRYRHVIRNGDGFSMKPGFRNFDPVRKGDALGQDRNGVVRARERGLVLLPLYQGLGDDGFFLGREVRPFWLRLSALLRRLGIASAPHLLPGVRRHPAQEETLVVNTWVARVLPLEVFHLLGYRKRRWRGHHLIVTRRREDSGSGA